MISDRSIDECECCGQTAAVKVYSVPTNGLIRGEDRALTTAIWCDECAESNKDLIISQEELLILAQATNDSEGDAVN